MADSLPEPLQSLQSYELEGTKHYKTAELIQQLGTSKATFYARLRELDLQPRRIKQATYLTDIQCRELLAYMDHLSRGGNLQGWKDKQSSLAKQVERTEPEPAVEAEFVPLENLQWLDRAAERGWWLSTDQLAELLGVTEGTIARQGSTFVAFGFAFERAPYRWGRQLQWLVHPFQGKVD